jgi:protein TonB
MLPESAPSPESRQFEIVEVKETNEEQLGQSEVEISSPQLKEAVKNIIQSDNTSDRIKVGDLVPIETVDVPPVATKKVNPKYPPAAFQRGIEETVVFRALISEFGNVLDVAFVDPGKTAPAFRKACDEAVRKWRFSPAKKGGVNVKVWKTFSIAFKKNKTE